MALLDTAGNSGSAAAIARYTATVSDLLYRALIRPIRDADAKEGNLFVRRFLSRPQQVADATAARVLTLPDNFSPVTVRDDLLVYLKDQVGLTPELDPITRRLSTAQLRKLISLAVPLWKLKGTAAGLIEVLRLLTGKTPVLRDWFEMRNILGEAELGVEELGNDNWIIGGNAGLYDEFLVNVRVMDDGSLDAQLLLDLVSLFRPTNERIEVALLDFLDVFDAGRGRWTTVAGTPGAWDTVNNVFLLHAGTVEQPITPRVAVADLSNYCVDYEVKIGAAANKHRLVLFAGVTTAEYRLELSPAATNQITLSYFDGAANNVLVALTSPFITLVAGVRYGVRVVVDTAGGNNVFHVYIDEILVIESVSADPGTNHGPVRVMGVGTNSADDTIDNFELFLQPLRFAIVGPGGITQTSNFL